MLEGKPAVELAKYSDIPTLFQTAGNAFKHDPLHLYLTDAQDAENIALGTVRKTLGASLQRIMAYTEYGYYVRFHSAYTVNRGAAFVVIERPRPSRVRRIAKRTLETVFSLVQDRRRTPEQRKRWKEFVNKLDAATKSAFGDDMENMLNVVYLATSPEHQGHGYGSALMTAANAEADKFGSSSWLLSSNIANTTFYESCGYVGVREIVMGDEKRAAWTKPPFTMLLMMRPGRSTISPRLDEKLLPL